VLEGVEVSNMHRQTAEREARVLEAATAVVAVSNGAGNRLLFESAGASVVDGGETMNPSTEALLAAIEATGAGEVVVLPDNPNVILAAEQAAGLAERPVRVVPTTSIQAGLAALVEHDPDAGSEANAAAMAAVLDDVAAGAVTVASRPVEGVAERGDYLGLVEREPVAGGRDLFEVAERVVEALVAEPKDVLTILTGADTPELDGLLDAVEARWPELEVHLHDGGQPHYLLLLSAE
jgi:fatty acid kinase